MRRVVRKFEAVFEQSVRRVELYIYIYIHGWWKMNCTERTGCINQTDISRNARLARVTFDVIAEHFHGIWTVDVCIDRVDSRRGLTRKEKRALSRASRNYNRV